MSALAGGSIASVMPRCAASGRTSSDGELDDLERVHRLHRQRQVPRLDARDVEHLVDQRQQVRAAAQDLRDALLAIVGQIVELEQLGEAEDRVERRPQVVAHVRQERALRAVRALCLEPRDPQRIVGLLALGDVDGDRADRVRAGRRRRAAET